jgi:micrococcal nuclease
MIERFLSPVRVGYTFFVLMVWLGCTPISNQQTSGNVVKVSDGDTIEVLVDNKSVRIRLFGIDAPERGQAFNVKAREFLASLVAANEITYEVVDIDQYKRVVADVFLSDGTHVNARMIEEGFAWHYKQFSDDEDLDRLEREARAQKKGLWADSNPMPPWQFRKQNRMKKV